MGDVSVASYNAIFRALDLADTINYNKVTSVSYAYDEVGNITYPNGEVVTNTYDSVYNLTSVKDPENGNYITESSIEEAAEVVNIIKDLFDIAA